MLNLLFVGLLHLNKAADWMAGNISIDDLVMDAAEQDQILIAVPIIDLRLPLTLLIFRKRLWSTGAALALSDDVALLANNHLFQIGFNGNKQPLRASGI